MVKANRNRSAVIDEETRRILETLHNLTDKINEIVYVIDPDNYEILFANKKTKEVNGENIVGKKCYNAFHNLNSPCLFCPNKYVFGENIGKTYTDEYQTSKNKRWYRGIDNAIKWPNGKYVLLEMAIDITEQKKMEESLRESERRYRNIIETAPIAIYTLSPDGTITSLNPAFEKITGWSRNEWLGKSFADIIHPDDLALATETFQKVLQGEAPPLYQLRVLSKSDEYLVGEFQSIPMIEGEKVVGEFGVASNITERKGMEEKLRESEELFRSIVENSHNCILIADDKFKIIYANDETMRLSGYPKEKIIGQDFRKFLPENSKILVEKRYLQRQKGENAPPQYEFKIVRNDGEQRDVEIKSAIIKDQQGRMCTIAQLLDITERKKMENERKRFEERLSTLNTYGHSLNMAKSMKEVYRLTLDAAERTLGFEYASVLIIEGKMLCSAAFRGYSENNFTPIKLPLDGGRGITVKVVNTGKPIFVPDVKKDKTYIKRAANIRSELAIPIKAGNKVIGVLNVESDKLKAFDEEDKKLLEALASHAATAISNLKRQEKLSTLNSYGRSLNKAENIGEICNLTLNAMEKVLGFKFVDVFLIEGKTLRLKATRGLSKAITFRLPLNGHKGVTVKAAKLGRPILVSDIRRENDYAVASAKGMLSELAVPIKLGNKVLGVLNVESDRLSAFDKEDRKLLEILASHTAIAISNLERREQLEKLSEGLEHLMKSSTKIMHVKSMHQRLEVIAKAIQNFGWRRVVISLRDENMEGTERVTMGLTKEEIKLLQERRAPGNVWQERLGPKFERFKIGEFYYLPWSDPWIREKVHHVPRNVPPEEATTYGGVPSKLSREEMVDWHPQDMIYAPLSTPEGRIVGILSMDDPIDGRKPAKESLAPLELFLHQAAITIENTQLMEGLREARKQLETYAGQLEQKVEERTHELEKSEEELLKAQRLAVIGELAGMVGHDLRNPLTSISGAEYYIKRKISSKADNKTSKMLELIEKNIEYSNKIINDLLEYSREIKLDLTRRSPKELVNEALSLVEIPKRIKVINSTENKPKINTDIGKMGRAFINIIKNASDAMPRGGTLTIKSKKVKENVVFTFSDTGVGMSKETIEKLWTPLFTTKAKGMGFGLPICKRVIEAHGGSILVESVPRKGTTFTVTIPIEPKTEEGGEKEWVTSLESLLLTTTKT
jgi:PAS domain S-box-containing protein